MGQKKGCVSYTPLKPWGFPPPILQEEREKRTFHVLIRPDISRATDTRTLCPISPEMLAHYSHVRMEAKRKALDALSSQEHGVSYGTKDDTPPADRVLEAQVIEEIGGRQGTRTPGLLVANEALFQLS
jgi:hypothetical protein